MPSAFPMRMYGDDNGDVTNLKPHAWDVTGSSKNFQTSCNTPYWHEAHHIVPHGELRDSIAGVGPGPLGAVYTNLIRGGLLKEEYNLNHKGNMIILPLDDTVAKALGLPRHRQTPGHRSHKAYSAHVRGRLDEVFGAIREQEDEHAKLPAYKACRQQIENISRTMRSDIKKAGGEKSLDEAFANK